MHNEQHSTGTANERSITLTIMSGHFDLIVSVSSNQEHGQWTQSSWVQVLGRCHWQDMCTRVRVTWRRGVCAKHKVQRAVHAVVEPNVISPTSIRDNQIYHSLVYLHRSNWVLNPDRPNCKKSLCSHRTVRFVCRGKVKLLLLLQGF